MSFSFAASVRRPARGLASHLAMALALAGGALVVTSAIAPDAHAQRRGQQQAGGNSPEFAAAYAPVSALVAADPKDWAGAKAQFETLAAQIRNEDDRNIAGNFALQIGLNTDDISWQRRGLQMMLQSGKVAPERLGQFNYFVGTISYQLEEYATARAALQAAMAAGHTADNPGGLIVSSYFEEGDIAGGLSYIEGLVAAGETPNQSWYRNAVQAAYDNNDLALTVQTSNALIRRFPTAENWAISLQRVFSTGDFEEDQRLDLLRLMRATGSITERDEYLRYVYLADSRKVPDEVLAVLAEGLAAGKFTATGDADYATELATANSRSRIDQQNMATILRDGDRGDQLDAMNAGDVVLSQGNYARAEAFYRSALAKGANADLANSRIGMAQQMAGNNAGAIETFRLVAGVRQPIAQMWALHAELASAN